MPLISGAQRNRDRLRASSTPRAQQKRRAARLPEYEPPSCPLDDDSLKALAQLSKSADTRKYEEQIKHSITLLTNNVRDINDRRVKRKEELAKLQRQNRSQSEGNGDDSEARKRQRTEEEALTRLRETVPALTAQCERAVREIIDLRVELEDGRQAVQDTVSKLESESGNSTNRKREKPENVDDLEDGDVVMGNMHRGILGPLHIWKNEKEKAAADYATRSLQARYAMDNDYVGFKRLWWDSVHSVDRKPIPDASRWFAGNNPGVEESDEEEEEEEEDLVIAQERISIYCPLSMVVMDEPYTSNICKHTFNKSAIVMFLRSQPGQSAKCPQTGCGKIISIKDFYDDQVILRKIKREKQRQNGEEEDEENGVDAEEDGDVSMETSRHHKAASAGDRED
ncbi:zinc-finger of the MIZ type in Nse subunit-domain-containing protein [Xylaria nigripes]|nr:zinc-finger of the MIZ type in Nse subunit-domain-containing protein [Xylaria nigripes]